MLVVVYVHAERVLVFWTRSRVRKEIQLVASVPSISQHGARR